MRREDFKKIIKLRSVWKTGKRLGNYKLPNGSRLKSYIYGLVKSQMYIDSIAINKNGNLCYCNSENNYILLQPFQENETCTFDEMEKRINILVDEIIYNK